MTESEKLAECIGKTQDLLRTILAEEVQPSTKVRVYLSEPGSHSLFHQLEEEVLNECHITFRACFHAFYPTGNLKWLCLCDLLGMLDPVSTIYDLKCKVKYVVHIMAEVLHLTKKIAQAKKIMTKVLNL